MLSKKSQKESIFRKTACYQLYGWLLFIVCALLFIVSSIRNWQPLIFAGSIIFLVACVLFVIPLVDSLREERNRTDS
jgi:cbb3-type cytochrome oxidase subunit 1